MLFFGGVEGCFFCFVFLFVFLYIFFSNCTCFVFDKITLRIRLNGTLNIFFTFNLGSRVLLTFLSFVFVFRLYN